MERLYISPEKDSPEICLDPKCGIFSISGISHPENIAVLFEPVLSWIDRLILQISKNGREHICPQNIKLDFFFIYTNSATYKYLITFLLKVCELRDVGLNLEITWYYEPDDLDMCDAGLELMQYLNIDDIPFHTEVKKRLKQ